MKVSVVVWVSGGGGVFGCMYWCLRVWCIGGYVLVVLVVREAEQGEAEW